MILLAWMWAVPMVAYQLALLLLAVVAWLLGA